MTERVEPHLTGITPPTVDTADKENLLSGYGYLPMYPDLSGFDDPGISDRARIMNVLSLSLIAIDSWRRKREAVPLGIDNTYTLNNEVSFFTLLTQCQEGLCSTEIKTLNTARNGTNPQQIAENLDREQLLIRSEATFSQPEQANISDSSSPQPTFTDLFGDIMPDINILPAADIAKLTDDKTYIDILKILSSTLHDMRNSIFVINQAMNLFERSKDDPLKKPAAGATLLDHTRSVWEEINNRLKLTEYLLNNHDRLEPVDLNFFREYVSMYFTQTAQKYGVDFQFTDKTIGIESNGKLVYCPPAYLQALIGNVVSNTHKETTENQSHNPSISCTITLDEGRNRMELRFEDNGNGMPEKIISDGFSEPVNSTHEGSGLGMHLMTDILQAYLGGYYHLENIIENGEITGARQAYYFRVILK